MPSKQPSCTSYPFKRSLFSFDYKRCAAPIFFPSIFLHTGSLSAFTHSSLHPWLLVGSGCQNRLAYNPGELSLEMYNPPGAAINQWLVSVKHTDILASWLLIKKILTCNPQFLELPHRIKLRGLHSIWLPWLVPSTRQSSSHFPTSLSIFPGNILNNKQIFISGSGELKLCNSLHFHLAILTPRQIPSFHTQCPH